MKPSVIVWDLETVPDLAGFAAANNLVGQTDADIREVLGTRFPKYIYK
jgi:3'-5' exonuclease